MNVVYKIVRIFVKIIIFESNYKRIIILGIILYNIEKILINI